MYSLNIYYKASGGSDKCIFIWDFREKKPSNIILAHSKDIIGLEYSLFSEYLLSVSKDGFTRTWSTFSGKIFKIKGRWLLKNYMLW